jgi:predicted metal-binding membrane protein
MASSASGIARLPSRDRIAILTALAGVTTLAWLHLVLMARDMATMDPAMLMELRPWSVVDFWMMFLMWAVMMVAMMVPTAAPMALIYAAVARKAARQGNPLAPTAIFVGGYIFSWTFFSLAATAAQWALERAALLSPMMVSTSPSLGAALLVGAGFYQLTPVKDACLRHCRAPARFISEHWRPGRAGAFRMGAVHGAWCLGCCWILMGLLFFGGVMNLLWIAGIAFFVLAEKLLPFGPSGGRVAGVGMIAVGLALLAAAAMP